MHDYLPVEDLLPGRAVTLFGDPLTVASEPVPCLESGEALAYHLTLTTGTGERIEHCVPAGTFYRVLDRPALVP